MREHGIKQFTRKGMSIPFQDEQVGHQVLGGFTQSSGIDIQHQLAIDNLLQDAVELVFVASRIVTKNGFSGADGDIQVGDHIQFSSLEQFLDFAKVRAIGVIGSLGAEIGFVKHKMRADEMDRTEHIIERQAIYNIRSILQVQVWFGDLDPGADDQLAGKQVTQTLEFIPPGFRLEETRNIFIWTNIPVLAEADLREAKFDRPATKFFRSGRAVGGKSGMDVIIERNIHSVVAMGRFNGTRTNAERRKNITRLYLDIAFPASPCQKYGWRGRRKEIAM